ncbi:hypothetical protein [Mesorhizobium sp. M5C.F.Ca.IN.020.29.1.1]|uniref:hypothetical protein n=1 Tax=Mesorhizobium sp. M5C.F.Ca.IN.020.29.1.1 TaxID=2496770 RepID=UPI0013E0A496|nr:hypothetical protein [Mesorhizobium sp. M5C.F.Ca.IN.020.29.1.1]
MEAIEKRQVAPQKAVFRRFFGHTCILLISRRFCSFAGFKTEYFRAPSKLIEPGAFPSVCSRYAPAGGIEAVRRAVASIAGMNNQL